MNKFLKDLEKELRKLNVNPKEIKEILEDHKEMIEAAKQEGLNEDEISLKFGDPVKVASEIHDDSVEIGSKIDLEDVESLTKFDIEKFSFVKGFTITSKELEFDISLISDNLILSNYEGEEIKVYQKDIKDIEKYDISLNNNNFTLKRERSMKIFAGFNSTNSGMFLVLIPKGLKSKEFNYHTVSGDVAINKLSVENFKLKSTNGDITLSNVDLGKTHLSMVNGNVEINSLKALSFDISLINGDIKIEKCLIDENIRVNNVSGNIELDKVECDTATFKTVSGDVDGKNFYVNEITYRSVSGDLTIKNDDKTREIKVMSKKTVSGDVNIN